MKTAVSISDELFDAAEKVAKRLGWSRSKLYSRALTEFLARESEDPVTKTLNELYDELQISETETPNVARELIESGSWKW